ncbi:MAG: phenazine-specific anthranilate synthase component I, partial [Aeromicrobium sp.]
MPHLHDVLAQPAFALIRVGDSDTVTLLGGERTDIERLADISLSTTGEGPGWDSLVLVPFAQARERGFEAHQDGTPLTVIAADVRAELPLR